jgi:hypothetical protein
MSRHLDQTFQKRLELKYNPDEAQETHRRARMNGGNDESALFLFESLFKGKASNSMSLSFY